MREMCGDAGKIFRGISGLEMGRKDIPLSHLDAEQSPRTCFSRMPSRRADALTYIDGH
jgi:hypothetical protein